MDEPYESFLRDIRAFIAESGMSESTFGLRAVNDAKLIERVADAGSVTTRTMHRVRQFIAAQRAGKAVA